ncbi:hypothetical protein KIW84_044605 [Lathyrus oleraceus]|uniref:Aminotransferase-like plant mobile domain-containing protein n=1 Tax=Pisum sativum TaxID=3888 RepID=A0A9D4XIL9_PEA|nr:hypothetical protein KIW84_044605 [Pisum sativum]
MQEAIGTGIMGGRFETLSTLRKSLDDEWITLQDVLFIWHLPIDGTPVLLERCPSDEAFIRVYPERPRDKKRMGDFYSDVARNTDFSSKQRKVAILMIILRAFVMPSFDGNSVPLSFVSLLEDVDSVSNYAWGAAILSFLLSGIENFRINKKKHLDGNFWVFLVTKVKCLVSKQGQPDFCNNLVVHHKPHLVAKQFELNVAELVDSFDFLEYL